MKIRRTIRRNAETARSNGFGRPMMTYREACAILDAKGYKVPANTETKGSN